MNSIPPPLRCWNDLAYTSDARPDQHAHLFVPPGPGPHPLILCMHGGGWTQGTHHGYARMSMPLARNGFAAATVGYRKVDHHPWPAPLDDLAAAFDFFKEHADTFDLDPDRFGSLGDSAGGHLALMLATVRPLFGVVSICGPTDVRPPVETSTPEPYRDLIRNTGPDPEKVAAEASPVCLTDRISCPVLQLQGEIDTVVPPAQAIRLRDGLNGAGIHNRLRLFPDADHGLLFAEEQELGREASGFFREVR